MVSKTRVAASSSSATNIKTKKVLGGHGSNVMMSNDLMMSMAGMDGAEIKKNNPQVLLARGLSARYCGANVPFTSLTAEEMERDLRHMEAFSNACIAYSQQYYIYQNSGAAAAAAAAAEPVSSSSAAAAAAAAAAASQQQHQHSHHHQAHAQAHAHAHHHPPMIAMPVRIDPEEEKRLSTLRTKIQQCEAQREILESQYLSLRAHYVYMSQRLKNHRQTVNGRVAFLQDLIQKRGKLLGLQRARLQIAREALACLHYRQSGGKAVGQDEEEEEEQDVDLVEVWNKIDEQFKQAEDACRGIGVDADNNGKDGGASAVESWSALKVPKIPPGVPLLLSQLAKPPGFAAAWSTAGMFGSKPESLCWLEPEFPEPAHRTKSLVAMREEVDFLRRELEKEQTANRDLQTGIIARRKANIELVAMMALLRTETEAVVARHNILLESDVAKDAALRLQMQEDEAIVPGPTTTTTTTTNAKEGEEEDDDEDEKGEEGLAEGQVGEQHGSERGAASTTAEPTTTPAAVVDPALVDAPTTTANRAAAAEDDKKTTDDDENDGDDEGEPGEEDEEDEGEILQGGAGTEKRGLDENGVDGSPRNKRRKL